MTSYKTPGVYIQEIATLPASIAPVATAIPAFIGYTEKDQGGKLNNKPTRITSMLEYEANFGGAYKEFFKVTLEDTEPKISIGYLHDDDSTDKGEISPYLLYYQIQMYFTNGGGPCYIVSIATYKPLPATLGFPANLPTSVDLPTNGNIDFTSLDTSLKLCEQEDEITLLVIPEATKLDDSNRATIYNNMLEQCSRLKDRFSIFDVTTDQNKTVFDDGSFFRNNHIGANDLKYGAAYYPALKTILNYGYEADFIKVIDTRLLADKIYNDERLSSILNGVKYSDGSDLSTNAKYKITIAVGISDGETVTINQKVYTAKTTLTTMPATIPTEFLIGTGGSDAASNLKTAIGLIPNFTINRATNELTIKSTNAGSLNILKIEAPVSGSISVAIQTYGSDGMNKALYNQIKAELNKQKLTLYPCGTIAGIYAKTDFNRGVWKAPANTSLNQVIAPTKLVTHEEQQNLNVDANSGKSINAIRQFAGRGNLVWGARTLAGNDAEWRYVNVRRLFIFMEESIEKATQFVVFEPNDANTWLRVKTMIENFLTGLWREGALAGGKPEEAFFVNVGLGTTMIADDILNGIMNVEIGIAAVRPAEFIILKFSHKLQES